MQIFGEPAAHKDIETLLPWPTKPRAVSQNGSRSQSTSAVDITPISHSFVNLSNPLLWSLLRHYANLDRLQTKQDEA